jgi:hypothetical protein
MQDDSYDYPETVRTTQRLNYDSGEKERLSSKDWGLDVLTGCMVKDEVQNNLPGAHPSYILIFILLYRICCIEVQNNLPGAHSSTIRPEKGQSTAMADAQSLVSQL